MSESEARRERRLDAIGAVVVLAIAAVAFIAARREPPAHYDPLGPGTAPTVVAMLLFALGAVLLVRALLGLRTGQAAQSMILGLDGTVPSDYRLRPDLAALCFATTGAYTATIALGLPFFPSTVAFLAGLGAAMAGLQRRPIAWVAVASLAGAFVVQYLFAKILLVPLP